MKYSYSTKGGLQNNCLNHILHLNNGETDDSSALLVIQILHIMILKISIPW